MVKSYFPSLFKNNLLPELDGSESGDGVWGVIGGKLKKPIKFPTSGGSRKMNCIPAHCSVDPKDHPEIGEFIQQQLTNNSSKLEAILKKHIEEMTVIKKKADDDGDDIVDDDGDDGDDDDNLVEKEEINADEDLDDKIDAYNNTALSMKRKREESKMSPQFAKAIAVTEEKASKIAKKLETDEQWLKLAPPVFTPIVPTLLPISKLSTLFVDAIEQDDKEIDENITSVTKFLNNLKDTLSKQNPEVESKRKEILKKKTNLLEKRKSLDEQLEKIENELITLVDEKKETNLIAYHEKIKLWEDAALNLKNINVEKRKAIEKQTEDREKEWLLRLTKKE